jgi:hypothetical protein
MLCHMSEIRIDVYLINANKSIDTDNDPKFISQVMCQWMAREKMRSFGCNF